MITVTGCGHDSHHPRPCDIEHKAGVPDYLILLIKKKAWVFLEGERHVAEPNSLICFPPDVYIHYGCDAADYNDDWIHFVMDERERAFFEGLKIPVCRIVYPYDFRKLSECVRMLSDCYHGNSAYKKEILDSFVHIFLYMLTGELSGAEENPGEGKAYDPAAQKYYQDFSVLRTRIYNDPACPWTVPGLAESLCLSLSYFQHLYKRFFGCTCQGDIIRARLDLAAYYLVNSEMSIRALADFCGYESELHFMRQFKKFMGMTPTEFRRRGNRLLPENDTG